MKPFKKISFWSGNPFWTTWKNNHTYLHKKNILVLWFVFLFDLDFHIFFLRCYFLTVEDVTLLFIYCHWYIGVFVKKVFQIKNNFIGLRVTSVSGKKSILDENNIIGRFTLRNKNFKFKIKSLFIMNSVFSQSHFLSKHMRKQQ